MLVREPAGCPVRWQRCQQVAWSSGAVVPWKGRIVENQSLSAWELGELPPLGVWMVYSIPAVQDEKDRLPIAARLRLGEPRARLVIRPGNVFLSFAISSALSIRAGQA